MRNESPLAGMTGLEPVMRESKSLALPLGYTPIGNPAFLFSRVMAPTVGFEPTGACTPSDFKSGALNRSATSACSIQKCLP